MEIELEAARDEDKQRAAECGENLDHNSENEVRAKYGMELRYTDGELHLKRRQEEQAEEMARLNCNAYLFDYIKRLEKRISRLEEDVTRLEE